MSFHLAIGVLIAVFGCYALFVAARRRTPAEAAVAAGIILNAPRYLWDQGSMPLDLAILGLALVVGGLFFRLHINRDLFDPKG